MKNFHEGIETQSQQLGKMARPLGRPMLVLAAVLLAALLTKDLPRTDAAPQDFVADETFPEEGSGEPLTAPPAPAETEGPQPEIRDFETNVSSEEVSEEAIESEENIVDNVAVPLNVLVGETIATTIVKARLNRTEELIEETVPETPEEVPVVLPELPAGLSTLMLKDSDAEDFAITFAGEESFVMVDMQAISLCPDYHLKLQFRSDLPNGLLAFLRQVPPTEGSSPSLHQYLYLKNGRLAIRSVVEGKRKTFVSQRGGLQDREWHTVSVSVSCAKSSIVLDVDGMEEVFREPALELVSAHEATGKSLARLWVGGLPLAASEVELPKLNIKRFRGCLRNVQFLQAPKGSLDEDEAMALEPLPVPLDVVGQHDVVSRITCVDKCLESKPCSEGSVCINHFSHASCDCSHLQTFGAKCEKEDRGILTLTGDGFLEHKLYTWQNRAPKRHHRLTFNFKTNTSDSVIFFARSLHPSQQYVSLALDNGGHLRVSGTFKDFEQSVFIKVDEKPFFLNSSVEGTPSLADNEWHHVVVNYRSEEATAVDLDPDVYFGYAPDFNQACHQPKISGDLKCRKEATDQPSTVFYFDPREAACSEMEYSGCGGNQNRFASEDDCLKACYIPGLVSYKPFIGYLKKVFVDGTNLLADLNTLGLSTRYTGQQPSASKGSVVGQVLSLTTPRSAAVLPSSLTGLQDSLKFELEFKVKGKGNSSVGVLAQGAVLMADTVDRWMVHSDGSNLFFGLDNNLVSVQSASNIKNNEWNKLTVSASTTEVTLSLNGVDTKKAFPTSLQYMSGVTFGGDRAALQGCIRNVKVDGGAVMDLRQLINRDKGVLFDGCKVRGPCEVAGCLNGGACSLSANNEVKCDCSDTGYEGNRCQFARYPESCEGYRRHGFTSPGRYRVDLDGDGPNRAIIAHCDFQDSGTITEIHHNVPQGYIVRKKGYKDHKVNVNYEDLSHDQLEDIVADSTSCSQSVSFECTRARLQLSSETWFSSPKMRLNSYFGTDIPGICPCKAIDECDKPNVPCNCDIHDGVARRDTAIITEKRQLPVTELSFIMDPATTVMNTKAALTMGPLVCYKDAADEDSVSLLDSESFLEFSSSSASGRLASVSFAFRTSAAQATVMHRPSFHPVQADYRLLLTTGNTLVFEYRHQDVFHTVTFHTTYRLNVAAWQYVWLDLSDQEIRVVLNGHTKFISLEKHEVLDGDFYLGGSPSDLQGGLFDAPSLPGLIGCLKDLAVNKEPMSLRRILRRSPTQQFNLGCQLSCDPTPCHNDALCIEKSLGEYECQCRNSYAESGKNCEKNLNFNSVTLLNADTEMRYANEKNVQNVSNPLKEDLTFSFRTRELQGLLVFVKDHVQNLLQIYLSKPNEISMLWNTGQQLQKMTINTGDEKLNKGYPVQLHLTRTRTTTTLHLLTRDQSFQASQDVGVELIEEKQYQQFPFGSEIPDPELSLYEQPTTLPQPYLKVHIGAAVTGGVRAKVPGFVGCFSGLKVGARHLDLKDRTIWSWNQNTYELGCYSACADGQQCLNGGLCMDVFHRGNDLTSQCDCLDTSYRGERCNQEIAFSFSGKDSLVFRNHYGVFTSPFTADFAFAVATYPEEEPINEDQTQALMILRDIPVRPEMYAELTGPSDLLAVGLHGSSELVILARVSILDSENLRTLKVNLQDVNITDGFRYHVFMKVNNKEIKVQINGAEFIVDTQLSALPEAPRVPLESLVVGGIGDLEPSGFPVDSWINFQGCISNVQFRTRDKKMFRPLLDYDSTPDDEESFTRQGLPNRTTCSSFHPKNLKAVVHNHAAYQAKTRGLPTSEKGPKRQSFNALERTAEEENDGSTIKTVGKVAAIFMGIVVVAVCIYLCKITRDSNARRAAADAEYGILKNVAPELNEQEEEEVHICKKRKGSSSGSSSESDKSLLLENATEMTELKQPSSTEAAATPIELKYVKETPEDKPSAGDTQEVQDEAKKDVEVVEDLQQQKVSDGTEEKVDQETEVTTPEIVVEASQEQTKTLQTEGDPSEETCDRTKDILARLGNNELEKSYTKLSESQEDVSQEDVGQKDVSQEDVGQAEDQGSSSTSNSSSTSDSSDTADAVAIGVGASGEQTSRKQRKKKSKRSGSYILHDSDVEEKPPQDPKAEAVLDGGDTEDEPTTVSASELKDVPQEADVEAIDAQNYFLTRQPSASPKVPPKKSS